MIKRVVGIYSAYDASEKTLCAMYLAEHVLRRYRRAVWIVPNEVLPSGRYAGFSQKWDSEVLPLETQTETVRERLKTCEICFFFDEQETLLSLLPKETKTAFFLDPNQWTTERSLLFAKKCTYSLSVSPEITKKIARRDLLENDIFCPFDSAAQIFQREHVRTGSMSSIFYNAYGMSFTERQCIAQTAAIVKECCPQSKSVICYYDTKEQPSEGRDSLTYDWRLLDYLKKTDWLIDLNPRPLTGLFTSFAGAFGIQRSCFSLSPNTDDYSAARRHLIPFPKGGLILSNAEEIACHLVRHLTTNFHDDTERNQGSGSYIKRLSAFTQTMNKLFGSKNR